MKFLHAILLALIMAIASPVFADSLLVAAGAGYKRPVSELATAFEKQTGHRLEQMYGHMGAIVNQTKQNGGIAVIFGDLSYLEKAEGIDFAAFLPLGKGRLVVAWPKGPGLKVAGDLASPRFARIAMPDTKSAIYGIAATEFLQRSGLDAQVRERLQVLATVPQVSAYLVSGEVDAGFINLTEALALQEKIGGYLEIDPSLYAPIRIVAGVIKGYESQVVVSTLQQFMSTPEARAILDKYGL